MRDSMLLRDSYNRLHTALHTWWESEWVSREKDDAERFQIILAAGELHGVLSVLLAEEERKEK